jgi:hypothetical protein
MKDKKTIKTKARKGEKGAALVMVLMIAFLLLVASAALLLEASMNTANVTDATAEQQAYYAAESGIQSALDVLRGNTTIIQPIASLHEPANASGGESLAWLNPLGWIETTASAAQSTPTPTPTPSPDPLANKIDFRKAVALSTSNKSTDTSTAARLSRWINYNYAPSGQTVPDRVTVGTGTYNPDSGMAFSVTVTDPDNIGNTVSFNTVGRIVQPDGTVASSYTITSGGNSATIKYNPVSPSPKSVTIAGESANTSLGDFEITYTGNGSGVALSTSVRFEIVVNMTLPYQATKVIRGLIMPGTIKSSSAGVTLLYDSQVYNFMGSWITVQGVTFVNLPNNSPPKIGYEIVPNAPNTASGKTVVNVSMTPPEPTRVLVRATGYGPRGSRKQLETIVQKNFFNGLSAPATLTLVGPQTKTGYPNFMFEPGNSQNVTYSGDDVVSNLLIPSIGTTNDTSLDVVESLVLCGKNCKTNIAGFPANVTEEMPTWLQNARNLDDTIESLKLVAKASGRYYTAGQTPPNIGDNANAKGITFVEGDFSMGGAGGGILICTGKLTLNGGFDFNGLMIITGAAGVRRSGGGNGEIHGNMVVAPYDKTNIAGGFLPPQFDTRGGGNSEMRYNSSSLANGMLAVSNFVQGVAEK